MGTLRYAQCHTDLALQLFQMQAYPQVEKELKRNPPDQQGFHEWSANHRGKSEITDPSFTELETVKKMLEIADWGSNFENQLDKASLTQDAERSQLLWF